MLPKYVVITAGGKGVRMNTPLPKQFMPIHSKPLLFYTIRVFAQTLPGLHIILVLPTAQVNYWHQLVSEHNFTIPLQIAEGGPTRFHSVKSGLKLVPDNAVVGIHDAVRPLVSSETIKQSFHLAEKLGNAIPAIEVTESMRITERAFNRPIARETLRIIQTPQCFRSESIKKAYNVNYDESFTDDASVLEKTGERIYLSEGNRLNIKITTPEDFHIASALLS